MLTFARRLLAEQIERDAAQADYYAAHSRTAANIALAIRAHAQSRTAELGLTV